jgi:hypothetical protein
MSLLGRLFGRAKEEPANPFGEGAPLGARPEPVAPSADEPVVSLQSPPAETTWTTVTVNGRQLPADQAQAFAGAFEQLGSLASLGGSQVIDLRGVPGLRDEVLEAMRAHADDPAALQQRVMGALQRHGVQIPDPQNAPPAGAAGDPYERLEKLDQLRDRGVLTDAEFEEQKKKLLGGL